MNEKYKPVRKKGAFNRDKTKKWDGKKWVAVNVVHKGQRAKLNGKTVVADGKGNWRLPGTRGNSLQGTKPGKVVGSYQSGDRNRTPSTTSRPTKPNNAAAINARLRKQKEERERALARTGSSSNTPKPKPKPDPTPRPKPSPAPKPAPAKAKPTPATSSNAQNLRQGRSPDKPARKSRTWLADNYKPGGPPKKNKTKKSLQIKPKKKKLTNKQRKQGGFH